MSIIHNYTGSELVLFHESNFQYLDALMPDVWHGEFISGFKGSDAVRIQPEGRVRLNVEQDELNNLSWVNQAIYSSDTDAEGIPIRHYTVKGVVNYPEVPEGEFVVVHKEVMLRLAIANDPRLKSTLTPSKPIIHFEGGRVQHYRIMGYLELANYNRIFSDKIL